MTSVPIAYKLVALLIYRTQKTSTAIGCIIATLYDVVKLYLQTFVHTISRLYGRVQHNFSFSSSLLLTLLHISGVQGVHHKAKCNFEEKV
jgi:hypothetical protein